MEGRERMRNILIKYMFDLKEERLGMGMRWENLS